MATRVVIVGRGRVGGALAANLGADTDFRIAAVVGRGSDMLSLAVGADMVLLAVPDGVVADVAGRIATNPRVLFVHFAGSLSLDALRPHRRRASLHP